MLVHGIKSGNAIEKFADAQLMLVSDFRDIRFLPEKASYTNLGCTSDFCPASNVSGPIFHSFCTELMVHFLVKQLEYPDLPEAPI